MRDYRRFSTSFKIKDDWREWEHGRQRTRIKETLFNMLSFYVEESRFLDLFSGSGGIGIEALSRGASQAVFVEQNRKAAACIEENLNHTHLREKAVVMSKDVMTALAF